LVVRRLLEQQSVGLLQMKSRAASSFSRVVLCLWRRTYR
jgi:hypothetical protein